MNRYFDKNDNYNSNSRIFDAYYGQAKKAQSGVSSKLRTLLAGISAARSSRAVSRAIRIAKASVFSCVLVGFLGVASAIESGALGIGAGLLISAVLLGVEYLCLRPRQD